MNRRDLMGTLGATAATLTAWQAFGQDKPTEKSTVGHAAAPFHGEDAVARCAEACSDCARMCDSCSTHCAELLARGKDEHLKTLHTCQDCADFCVAAAQIVARRGTFSDLICQSCAEACARCAKECEAHKDDRHMQACAEECRKCEKACREMVKAIDHHHAAGKPADAAKQ